MLIAPVAESDTLTWFAFGGSPATQFWFEDSGRVAPDGNTVRKLLTVPLTVVTFAAIPVAVFGIVQLPLVPHTANVAVSPPASGVERLPTVSVARVSSKRHGTMGTIEETSPGAALRWPDRLTTDAVAAASAAATPRCTKRYERMGRPLLEGARSRWDIRQIRCERRRNAEAQRA
jgi:hypothetical protein